MPVPARCTITRWMLMQLAQGDRSIRPSRCRSTSWGRVPCRRNGSVTVTDAGECALAVDHDEAVDAVARHAVERLVEHVVPADGDHRRAHHVARTWSPAGSRPAAITCICAGHGRSGSPSGARRRRRPAQEMLISRMRPTISTSASSGAALTTRRCSISRIGRPNSFSPAMAAPRGASNSPFDLARPFQSAVAAAASDAPGSRCDHLADHDQRRRADAGRAQPGQGREAWHARRTAAVWWRRWITAAGVSAARSRAIIACKMISSAPRPMGSPRSGGGRAPPGRGRRYGR